MACTLLGRDLALFEGTLIHSCSDAKMLSSAAPVRVPQSDCRHVMDDVIAVRMASSMTTRVPVTLVSKHAPK